MKAILFRESGFSLFNSDFNNTIPDAAIEIPDELYTEICANQDGIWKLVNGEIVKLPLPEPEPYIPQSVTPAQGLMALYALKTITEGDILAAIANIEDPALRYQAQVTYNKATTWQRTSGSMQVVAGLLALTELDLDELFTLAATYTNL